MINFKRWIKLKVEWEKVERTTLMDFSWHEGSGNGDLFVNECKRILMEKDDSKEAHEKLGVIAKWLFLYGKRWPDYFSKYITTTNHKQTDLTKDPIIYFYCTSVFLGRYDLIKLYKPPTRPIKAVSKKWRKWSFFLPWEYAWYNALLGKDRAWKIWRRLIPYFILPWHTYVLYGFMEVYATKAKEYYKTKK